MKVQLAPGTVRLRVTRAEFDELRAGTAVTLALAIPGGSWRVDVAPAPAVSISLADGHLVIGIPRADLDVLLGRLPAREGLGWQIDGDGGSIALVFEVDIRDRPRAAAPVR